MILKNSNANTSDTGDDAAPRRVDRRIARTRSMLRGALDELIHEKGYDAVTVEEITQRAGLGRATFYLHYRDKEDLLLEEFSELAHNRVKLISDIPLTGWDEEANQPYPPLLIIFQNAAEYADLYRAVLHSKGGTHVTARLREIIGAALSSLVQAGGENGSLRLSASAPLDFLATYLAAALVGTIAWWLEQPPPYEPVEMTRTFQRLFFPGAARVFGIQNYPPARAVE